MTTFSTKNPIKRNMEEGGFSLMRKIFNSATSTKRNNTGSTQNLSFQDTSSYIEKRKALSIGKKNLAKILKNAFDHKRHYAHKFITYASCLNQTVLELYIYLKKNKKMNIITKLF